jgi:hypothetical protein
LFTKALQQFLFSSQPHRKDTNHDQYPTGKKVSDEDFAANNIEKNTFHV